MRKLLLLYLFVTFCFGLVFNTNSNAAVIEVCDVGPGNHLVKVHPSERKYYKNSILINAPYMSCATHFKKKGKILYKAVKRRLKKTQYKIEWSGELLEKRSRGYTHTILDTKYAKILRSFNSNIKFSNDEKQIAAKQKKIEEPKLTGGYSLDTTWDGIYKWNGIVVSKDTYCFNADLNNMSKYYPNKYNMMCGVNSSIVKSDTNNPSKKVIYKKVTDELNPGSNFTGYTWNGYVVSKAYYCDEAIKAGMPQWGNELFLKQGCSDKLLIAENSKQNSNSNTENLFDGIYKWNGKVVTKSYFCNRANVNSMHKYYPKKYKSMCGKKNTQVVKKQSNNTSNILDNYLLIPNTWVYLVDMGSYQSLAKFDSSHFIDNKNFEFNHKEKIFVYKRKVGGVERKYQRISKKTKTRLCSHTSCNKRILYAENKSKILNDLIDEYTGDNNFKENLLAYFNKKQPIINSKKKIEIVKNQEIGIPKNLIGSYEGKNSQGDPFKLNINTNKYGEIIGNYTYEANNKVYGGPLYDGKLLDDQTLKIFWTEGDTNGWFKFKFRENFAKLDGDWGFIENNRELPKKGKYKGVKANTAIAKKSEQEEFKPKNFDKDPPVIKIAENITVKDSSYEIEGTLIDKSKKLFVEVDGEFLSAKNGKFKIKRFSLVDEKIEIVAIDQWGNRSNPKIINIKIDDQDTQMVQRLEPLDPSKIRSKINKNRVALIIGIENYEQTPDATYANLDAKYFYEYARKGFGVQKSNIKLLVDEDANLISSLGTINKWLPGKVKENRTELFVFFAGHGLASNDGKELYILPQDSDPDLLSRTALSRNELFSTILNLNPKSVTMFFDTCFSGISRDEKILLASARPIRIIADEQEGTPDNFTIFSASQLNQISSGLEEANHGIFSYFLMKGLEGNADTNKDKKITNGELLAYMEQNVSMKASELGRQQNPSLTGDPDKILMRY